MKKKIPKAVPAPDLYQAGLFVRRPELPPLVFNQFESLNVTGFTHEDAFQDALAKLADAHGYKLVRKEP